MNINNLYNSYQKIVESNAIKSILGINAEITAFRMGILRVGGVTKTYSKQFLGKTNYSILFLPNKKKIIPKSCRRFCRTS